MISNNDNFISACKNGDLWSVIFLVEFLHVNIYYYNSGFRKAYKNGHINIMKYLIYLVGIKSNDNKNGVNIHIDKSFMLASRRGDLEIIKYLIDLVGVKSNDNERGINIHTYSEYAFRSACHYGHINLLKYLIKLVGIKSNDNNGQSLLLVNNVLINPNGIDIHVYNEAAFRGACGNENLEIVKKRSFFGHKLCL